AEYRLGLKRPLHTLKGGARMAGIMAMGDLSHELETLVMQVDNGSVAPNDALFETVQASLDELARMRELVANGRRVSTARAMIARIHALSGPKAVQPAGGAPAPAAGRAPPGAAPARTAAQGPAVGAPGAPQQGRPPGAPPFFSEPDEPASAEFGTEAAQFGTESPELAPEAPQASVPPELEPSGFPSFALSEDSAQTVEREAPEFAPPAESVELSSEAGDTPVEEGGIEVSEGGIEVGEGGIEVAEGGLQAGDDIEIGAAGIEVGEGGIEIGAEPTEALLEFGTEPEVGAAESIELSGDIPSVGSELGLPEPGQLGSGSFQPGPIEIGPSDTGQPVTDQPWGNETAAAPWPAHLTPDDSDPNALTSKVASIDAANAHAFLNPETSTEGAARGTSDDDVPSVEGLVVSDESAPPMLEGSEFNLGTEFKASAASDNASPEFNLTAQFNTNPATPAAYEEISNFAGPPDQSADVTLSSD